MEKILTIYVNCTSTQEVISDNITVRQILFDGYARGKIFNGMILPGGVDTQTISKDGAGTLNARYMLRGTDSCGDECMLYIENTAEIGKSETKPSIVTDSKNIGWVKTVDLVGQICDDDGLRIDIYVI